VKYAGTKKVEQKSHGKGIVDSREDKSKGEQGAEILPGASVYQMSTGLDKANKRQDRG